MAGRDQLFGQRAGGFTGWSRGKAALDRRSGVKNWTTHDIRRSVATEHGRFRRAAAHHREILNHQSGHKRRAGGHLQSQLYEREVRAALALWHDHVRTLVAGGKRKIVCIRAARCLLMPSAAAW